ncbi:MAG: cohesin domain-containing protein [Terriglobales bacterium]
MNDFPSKSWIYPLVLAAAFALATPRLYAGDKGAPYYRHGEYSMAHHNYDQAYVDFREALKLAPGNVKYQIATHQAQFAAANAHIQQGETLKAKKDYPAALKQFKFAQVIDPANFIAEQEVANVGNLLHPPPPPPGETVTQAQQDTLQARLARAAGPVELGPVSNAVIKDFTVNSDPENAYRAAGKLAGLNVIFDTGGQGGYSNSSKVSLDLHDISVMQILHVLNVQTDSFYTPITPNTILVASNNRTTHQQVDPTVLKVFYLKNVQTSADLSEIAAAVRGLVQPQPHIMPVASIDALVMRDTPDKVAMVQRVLDDIDKAPPEVVVQMRILQVNRTYERDLGLLPPTSIGIGLTTPSTTTTASTGTGTTGTGTTGGTTTNGGPTLNTLKGLDSNNYAITIPNATLSALLSNSNTQTIQEPTLRAVQGQKAQLQIGEKIPIATGSFQPGVGGVGINPLVNTQFQYQPVGVIINLTPQVQGDQSILLKEHIEISSVNSYTNLGGISQPIIGNNLIDHTIEVKNGQSVVLGGLNVNTVEHDVNGIPGLSSIPLFRYLFSSETNKTSHQEILIIETPHIVHQLNITPEDLRALYTGTENDVHLHLVPQALAGSEAGSSTPGAAEESMAPALPSPTAPALELAPAAIQAKPGQTFQVKIAAKNAADAYAFTFQLNFDPKLLQLESMSYGRFLQSGNKPLSMVYRQDAVHGTAEVSLSRPVGAKGVSGAGNIVTVTFRAKAAGTSQVSISRLGARSPQGAPQKYASVPATVVVQ